MLDSSALVAAEREGLNARRSLEMIGLATGDDDLALSVMSLLELSHGIARAETTARREKRQRFLDEVTSVVPVYPITRSIALKAGKVDGEAQSKGIRIPLSDLLIGMTAVELRYRVATHDVRHFSLIPDLEVVRL